MSQALVYPSDSTKKAMDVPITSVMFTKLVENWPPVNDWCGVLSGMLSLGSDLRREPCDITFRLSKCGAPLELCGLQITKGFKRLSCMGYILVHAMKMAPDDAVLL